MQTPVSLTHGSGRIDLQPKELNNSEPFSLTQDLQKYQSADISTRPDEVCSGNLIVGTELKYLSDVCMFFFSLGIVK